ncbi:uncharacterized protein LACBIDRAFT_315415 [Laccaria bicolor S238N-H82]|uniref:Predicted protein n=1 Tax=Laccaria bicolor (strain S238N-H82 / ATCC MYA-4686) TaxID=486041 RepID=B0D2C1_LACBS|nr:uncharacterized protein LACBIDRAFT_315415 [Laccaria bicolor S238N-H82]EDR10720.1 predicted protein [Laccaria bicolor S238N-H82]|eukprot:XP_001878021.1 predicted protein [Laccaria bicolor S238N-H82]
MCGDEVFLGFDPTVSLNDNGDVVSIVVRGTKSKVTYIVDQKLHVATGLTGRCTRVWQAHSSTDPKQSVIIKDAWPSVAKASKESEMLARLKDVTGVPNVITAITVKTWEYGDKPKADTFDTTDRVRREIAPSNYRTRKHRRLVMGTLGIKVHHFETLSELIGAFQDVIAAHRDACARGVLHRDISLNNIMLQGTSPNRKGLLIDFDHALYQQKNDTYGRKAVDVIDDNDINSSLAPPGSPVKTVAVLEDAQVASKRKRTIQESGTMLDDVQLAMEQTGTPLFIATALLLGTELHQDKHDLESIFYAFLYALMAFKGPGATRNKADFLALPSMPAILDWFDLNVMQTCFSKMAHIKMGHFCDFERTFIKKMDPYFNQLHPFIRSLFAATFTDNHCDRSHLDHNLMLNLFNTEYERLLALEKEEEDEGRPRKHAKTDKSKIRGSSNLLP